MLLIKEKEKNGKFIVFLGEIDGKKYLLLYLYVYYCINFGKMYVN